jgi:hypothetical protein
MSKTTVSNIAAIVKKVDFDVEEHGLLIETLLTKIPNRKVITRKDNGVPLGIVSNHYKLHKHADVVLQPLKELEKQDFIALDSHLIRQGAKVVIELISKSSIKIADTDYKSRLLLINSYDATTALRVCYGFASLDGKRSFGLFAEDSFAERLIHVGTDVFNTDGLKEYVKLGTER